nr:nucleotide-binding alpha-beta plait domain-containing protein [Tanacetum cinerariifolium]
MGSFRSKEDDLSKISTSIFVSNFSESFSAKDLFHSCKQYGHVVYSFIPTKRMKDGKRFGFVRFINVFNVERLVNNLCTIWVGRLKLHANVARFKRDYMKGSCKVEKNATDSNNRKFDATPNNVANNVLEFVPEGRLVWVELDGVPFKFWSGSTFKRIATKWGELLDEEDDTSVENNINGRTNDHEANNGFEESDAKEVPETLFEQPDDQKNLHSEDPFGIYPLLNKDNVKVAQKVIVEDYSLSHPSGFTPEGGLNDGNNANLDSKNFGENERGNYSSVKPDDDKDNSDSVNKKSESKHSGCPKYPVLTRTGGSILNLMEEVVKVGQTMGYNMDGCINDITEIVESQGEFGVNR